MSRFFTAVKAGIRGAMGELGPGRFQAAGRMVACTHCGADQFQNREAQLNTTGAAVVGLEWMNRSGTALVCVNCGLVQWFAKTPERVPH
jgi:predicted nucleic-acid-binding Zn-ribbon protein